MVLFLVFYIWYYFYLHFLCIYVLNFTIFVLYKFGEMISKELFIGVLDKLESQYRKDVNYMEGLSGVLGFKESILYDNSDLVKSVLDLLRFYFPVDDDGFCELQHWMYALDFGKCGDEYEDSGQLYDRLIGVIEGPPVSCSEYVFWENKTLGID